jgi:hypothetical protein
MQTSLENKKVATNSPRSVLKRKNKVEEGRALGSGMNREHVTYVRAQKMMRGKVEPFRVPIMVHAMPIAVHVDK